MLRNIQNLPSKKPCKSKSDLSVEAEAGLQRSERNATRRVPVRDERKHLCESVREAKQGVNRHKMTSTEVGERKISGIVAD